MHRETDVLLATGELEPDLALIGELHRVAGEVDEDLPDLVDVAGHPDRRVGDDPAEGELLLPGERLDHGAGGAHEVRGEEVGRTNGLASLVEAREGEDFL